MKVWPVKHSPLLRQPERFIARSELQALIRNVTQNLVNIKDESGQFLLRLDDGRVIDTKGWAGRLGVDPRRWAVRHLSVLPANRRYRDA